MVTSWPKRLPGPGMSAERVAERIFALPGGRLQIDLGRLLDRGVSAIIISGPDLVIGERALTSLALVLHELATNAVKYGALSVGQGVVHVTWQIEADNLMLRWYMAEK